MVAESVDDDLHGVVQGKLARIFGQERAEQILGAILGVLALEKVRTTSDLERVATLMQTRPGFEATAGTVLSVMAALRRSQGR